MIFKRKAYDKLLEWKRKSNGSTAVLIEGARRIGKSFIAQSFGRNEYASYAVLDFASPKKKVLETIENDPGNLKEFFRSIEFEYGIRLFKRNSLIIFDEVQFCPKARQMIKHLVAEGSYDYIETGSLVSIYENVKDILIPSEERRIDMFPMDFEEFLWAKGDNVTSPYLMEAFSERKPLGRAALRTALQRFREYLMVGGMPQAVEAYIGTDSFESADMAKRGILELYYEGIGKHAGRDASRAKSIYAGLPGQLSKKEKKYSFSSLGADSRYREYEDAFLWLGDSRIVNPCYNATDPAVGLALSADYSKVKLYSADTGLLITHFLMEEAITGEDIYRELYSGNLGVNEGMIAENYVAQALRMSGRELFFYSRYDNGDASGDIEIDFLIRKEGKICPIEVKSGRNTTHKSLDKFRKKFAKKIGEPILVSGKDLKVQDGIFYIPICMAMFL